MLKCRICSSKLTNEFINLGMLPLANSYVPMNQSNYSETFYPLKVFICGHCYLVQLEEYETPQNIFGNYYAYFSSISSSFLEHAKNYVEEMIHKYGIDSSSHVLEVASNDGYLLQYFLKYNIKVTGVEPANNCAEIAIKKGIHTEVLFFNTENAKKLLKKRGKADLMLGNNVLAHVTNIHDFVSGFKIMLSDQGVITFEFPHVLKLIELNQFDTIYHEHYSYLSLISLLKLFDNYNLRIFDIKQINTHGGSLRLYICHKNAKFFEKPNVKNILNMENKFGLFDTSTYKKFKEKVLKIKEDTYNFFVDARKNNKLIIGYGAAAKGNTFLNYCGIGPDDLKFVVDKNQEKQNTLLPGTRIPVLDIKTIKEYNPDYIFILPWNLKEEISSQIRSELNWNGKFVTAIPELNFFK